MSETFLGHYYYHYDDRRRSEPGAVSAHLSDLKVIGGKCGCYEYAWGTPSGDTSPHGGDDDGGGDDDDSGDDDGAAVP